MEGTAVVAVRLVTKTHVGGRSRRVLPAFSFALLWEREGLQSEKNLTVLESFGLPFPSLRVRVEEIYSVKFRTTKG